MVREPNRRSVLVATGAAAAASALPTGASIARDDPPGPAYRTTGDLIAALAEAGDLGPRAARFRDCRIEALDPKINAVVVRDFDRARIAADAADAPWRGASAARCSACR
jgi:amidase